jgi:hypothetical protein
MNENFRKHTDLMIATIVNLIIGFIAPDSNALRNFSSRAWLPKIDAIPQQPDS